MKPLTVSMVATLAAPPEGSDLVVFCDSTNYVADYDSNEALLKTSRYAKHHKVYTVSRRFIADDYICLAMFAPDGSPLAAQRATHLNLDYRGRLRRDDSIEVFDTPFGKIALLVDVDINMPQVPRAAVLSGAEILIASQFVQLFDFFEEMRYAMSSTAAKKRAFFRVSRTAAASEKRKGCMVP